MLTMFVDTREQKPLDFNEPYINSVVSAGMNFGDYGCKVGNYRVPVVFERKSKADLWGTLGGNKTKHDRFKRELARAKDAGFKLILIIECLQSDVLKGHSYKKKGRNIKCKFGGLAMLHKLFTMMFKYDMQFVFCKNREEMAKYIATYYNKIPKQ